MFTRPATAAHSSSQLSNEDLYDARGLSSISHVLTADNCPLVGNRLSCVSTEQELLAQRTLMEILRLYPFGSLGELCSSVVATDGMWAGLSSSLQC